MENQPQTSSFSFRRILWVLIPVFIVIAAVAWYAGSSGQGGHRHSDNSILVLMPYRHAGTWVFDDPTVKLVREPFVAGVPEIIDEMVKDIPDAESGFRLIFSTQPFPGYTEKLVWLRGDKSGNWYRSESTQKEGWICPAMFKYFKDAPKEIYAKAEKK